MNNQSASREHSARSKPGGAMLVGLLVFIAAIITLIVILANSRINGGFIALSLITGLVGAIVWLAGFFIVEPNQARVLVLFGRYRGSVRMNGFYWTNPFTKKIKLSLKADNLASDMIKVNDLAGNPIEIATVVVFRVRETAQATFDVEDYRDYVDVQVESAVRQLAKSHPYDENSGFGDVPTLRGDTEQVTVELQDELQARLDRAGIEVLEARVTHLAYAQEIASAMLQRQQADAIVAAREKIVNGAVGMVEHALSDLSKRKIVELDDAQRAAMVGNLLVVLCSHSPASPVVNTGSPTG